MDKKLAIEKLDNLRKQLINLPICKSSEVNSGFNKWHRATVVALEHIFGSGSKEVLDFEGISYDPWVIVNNMPYQKFDAHNKGKLLANDLLESFIDEIEEYGLENKNDKSSGHLQLLEKVLSNFHRAARQLLTRHSNRETLEIKDEYDVQDLLHSILKLYFDDVRSEDSVPSYAGGNSRIDFVLNDHGIAIEVKKTRSNLKDKEIGEELMVDIGRYPAHKNIKMLVCFIYDPENLIRNPTGLENDLMKTPSDLEIKVIICPKI